MNKRKQTSICKKGRAGAKRDKCWVYEKGRGKWEAAVQESSIYPAWRPPQNPATIPLGGGSRIQHLSRLAAVRKPSVYPAWQLPTNPAFIPLGGDSGGQCLSRLAAIREPSIYPAWQPPQNPATIPLGGDSGRQCLFRLAAVREPSIYPAWRLHEGFICRCRRWRRCGRAGRRCWSRR